MRTLYVGIVLVGLSATLYFLARSAQSNYDWTPIVAPLSFGHKQNVSRTFTADHDATYWVEVDLRRRLPFPQLEAVVNGLSWAGHGAVAVPVPLVTYSVSCGGRQVLRGHSGSYYGPSVGAMVGTFAGVRGRRYTVLASVQKPLATLQVLDPHLQVETRPSGYPVAIITAGLVVQGSLLALLAGMAVLAVTAARAIRSRDRGPGNQAV